MKLYFGKFMVKIISTNEVLDSGIVLPYEKNDIQIGEVVKIPEKCEVEKPNVIIGDILVFSKNSGTDITYNNTICKILIEDNIIFYVKDKTLLQPRKIIA